MSQNMLLPNRPSGIRLFSSTAFIIFCLIFFLIVPFRRTTNWNWGFPPAAITATAIPTATSNSAILEASATIPISTSTTIPEKIWYKLGPKGLSDKSREWIDTCLKKNPTYRSEFITELAGDLYVRKTFAHRPDIVETYLTLPVPILKADMLRYLLLFSEGGIWSDLDVSCEDTPIRDWIPAQYKNDANLVVGVEFDVGLGYAFERQFATWMVMAKPRSPHLLMAVEDILVSLRETTERHNVTLKDLTLDMIGDVIYFTGPRRLSRSVTKSLGLILNEKVDNANLSMLYEPRLIGDVLILPGYSFAASVNTYGENQGGAALVRHHYSGSWKNKKGGEEV